MQLKCLQCDCNYVPFLSSEGLVACLSLVAQLQVSASNGTTCLPRGSNSVVFCRTEEWQLHVHHYACNCKYRPRLQLHVFSHQVSATHVVDVEIHGHTGATPAYSRPAEHVINLLAQVNQSPSLCLCAEIQHPYLNFFSRVHLCVTKLPFIEMSQRKRVAQMSK